MEKQGDDKKFTWVLKDLDSHFPCSDTFVIGGCKWRLVASYPSDNFLVYLVRGTQLPYGWQRYVKYRLTIVNQFSKELSIVEEGTGWFSSDAPLWGGRTQRLLTDIQYGGFMIYGEVRIVVEVDVLEVIGGLDVPYVTLKDSIDVNGFQVLPSQVKSVTRIFERHPDIALKFRAKNQLMRKTCMNFLLSLIETLCQSLQELSNEDLVEADIALTYLKDAGFKVDWLEKKLDQIKERKEKEQCGLVRLQEIEERLLKLKQKCSDLGALVEKEKKELLNSRTPLSFDDLV